MLIPHATLLCHGTLLELGKHLPTGKLQAHHIDVLLFPPRPPILFLEVLRTVRAKAQVSVKDCVHIVDLDAVAEIAAEIVLFLGAKGAETRHRGLSEQHRSPERIFREEVLMLLPSCQRRFEWSVLIEPEEEGVDRESVACLVGVGIFVLVDEFVEERVHDRISRHLDAGRCLPKIVHLVCTFRSELTPMVVCFFLVFSIVFVFYLAIFNCAVVVRLEEECFLNL